MKIGFASLLRVLLIGQSTIKLYHKKQIDPERLAQTVSILKKRRYRESPKSGTALFGGRTIQIHTAIQGLLYFE